MLQEFKNFLMRGNVVDLAVGVIIGASFSKIVSSLVDDLLEKKQSLEGDVQSLSHLRDQLALALVTMEQNTDRITAWLKEKRESIIVTRHQLMRNRVELLAA